MVLNRYIRYALTRFRFGVSDIKMYRLRFKIYNVDDLKCPLCLSAVAVEFLLQSCVCVCVCVCVCGPAVFVFPYNTLCKLIW